MLTIDDDLDYYIYLRDGTIVYESRFEKNFCGDLKFLLDCIEDNIYLNENEDERINFNQAKKDYQKEVEKLACGN